MKVSANTNDTEEQQQSISFQKRLMGLVKLESVDIKADCPAVEIKDFYERVIGGFLSRTDTKHNRTWDYEVIEIAGV